MSQRDPSVPVAHMVLNAKKAIDVRGQRTRAELEADDVRMLALVRLLEVVGEAARRVPTDVQLVHPEVPWSGLIGLRNRLIHGYDTINNDVLWKILTEDLPGLVPALERMLSATKKR